jgi:outer membrane cobalamin receptor
LRAPYLNELVRGYQIGAVAYRPDPYLLPERSHTEGAGLDWDPGANRRLAFDFTTTRVHDAIVFETIGATTKTRANLDRTQTDGFTLTYGAGFARDWHVSVSATTQYARVTSGPAAIVGKRLAFVPNRCATLSVERRFGPLGIGASGSYLGQVYADDLNAQPLGSAFPVDAHADFALRGGAALRVFATNLTDRRYLSSIDRYAPPAFVGIRLQVPLGLRSPA